MRKRTPTSETGERLKKFAEKNLACPMKGKRVLLLGAGGAVRGALLPFARCEPALLVVANRTLDKAQELVSLLQAQSPVATHASSFEALTDEFDIVVNGTSAGLFGAAPAIAASVFAPKALAYEMVYGKGATPFLQQAKQAGAQQLADGVGMLVEQAALAFAWWRGVRPDTRAAIERLSVPIVFA